ncbi:hypothetical protein HHI36_008730 [Cryptolaemus montrouzieri]|uniref:Uncharacterized protein n=1 Tax=Cryptolaemus montrouzieri TaxID=559131 RepID=A0ABD2MTE2_9CUCU
MSYWNDTNPYRKIDNRSTQNLLKLNVSAGIINDTIEGPFFMEGNLNGPAYKNLLRGHISPPFQEIVGNDLGQTYFQRECAVTLFAWNVMNHLDQMFDDKGKRKSDLEDEQPGNNEKIARTHHKSNRKNGEKVDILIETMKELKTEVHQIEEKQNENSDFIKRIIEKNTILKKENEEIRRENFIFKEDLGELKRQKEWMEKEKKKKNNVVVTGNGKHFINEDMTKREREEMKGIREFAENEKGKRVKIGYNKVKDLEWRWNENSGGIEKINDVQEV